MCTLGLAGAPASALFRVPPMGASSGPVADAVLSNPKLPEWSPSDSRIFLRRSGKPCTAHARGTRGSSHDAMPQQSANLASWDASHALARGCVHVFSSFYGFFLIISLLFFFFSSFRAGLQGTEPLYSTSSTSWLREAPFGQVSIPLCALTLTSCPQLVSPLCPDLFRRCFFLRTWQFKGKPLQTVRVGLKLAYLVVCGLRVYRHCGWLLWVAAVGGFCGCFLWVLSVGGSCGWFLWASQTGEQGWRSGVWQSG